MSPGTEFPRRVALVGYGEAGRIFAAALAKDGACDVSACDILASVPAWATPAHARATADGVRLAPALAEALQGAGLVISAVTAEATATAASQIAHAVAPGAWVLDVNSASPRTKLECARIVNAAGARYVEAAVMSAVPPFGLRVPMLLGGPHAEAVLPALERLGFEATVGATDYGTVSAIKLCRSIFVKGLEALTVEGLRTARHYGVEDAVLASLARTFPGLDWDRQVEGFWQRVLQHGQRRAEEMREAAVAVADAGITPRMASSTAEVQAQVAALRAQGAFDGLPGDAGWRAWADRCEAAEPQTRRATGS
ncbi:hypothetical protein BWI17_14455 [Betaproteobacteria bacterium GR16-43]|nr:hypothetical protein BWI17_14455 [Betaproteobacteria bacterium GR16-43]